MAALQSRSASRSPREFQPTGDWEADRRLREALGHVDMMRLTLLGDPRAQAAVADPRAREFVEQKLDWIERILRGEE